MNQKNSNHLVRELKWLDAKEPDPSIIKIWELRGRNVKEELHTPSMKPPSPGPVHVQSTAQTLDNNTSAYNHQLTKVPQHQLPQFYPSPFPI